MYVNVRNKETGDSIGVALEKSMTLLQVRKKLEEADFMPQNVMFLSNDSIVRKEDEGLIALDEVIDTQCKPPKLLIGLHCDIDPLSNVSDFTNLTNSEIMDFFKKKQLCRGLIFSKEDDIKKTSVDTFTLTSVPDFNIEANNTYSSSYYAFSKQSLSLSLRTSDKSSLSLNTPFLDVSAEYARQKSAKTNSEAITEYLLSKYVVSLISFKINPKKCLPSDEFIKSVNHIMTVDIEPERKAVLLLEELDTYGLYIPVEFTMGGALYAEESTKINEFSMAETEKNDFSVSVNAKFNGYGGGASTSGGTENESTVSSSSKYKNVTIQQIGGKAGSTENKDVFISSLETLSTWEIVDIIKFYPSVFLLAKARNFTDIDPTLFIKVKNLLNRFYNHKFLIEHQPCINMRQYIDILNEPPRL